MTRRIARRAWRLLRRPLPIGSVRRAPGPPPRPVVHEVGSLPEWEAAMEAAVAADAARLMASIDTPTQAVYRGDAERPTGSSGIGDPIIITAAQLEDELRAESEEKTRRLRRRPVGHARDCLCPGCQWPEYCGEEVDDA